MASERMPIKRGVARRLGLDLPQDQAVYDEIDWSRLAPSAAEAFKAIESWQRSMVRSLTGPPAVD